MKQMLINSMVSFTLGTGASLIGLYSWLGTSDLQEIKTSVQNYVMESEVHSSALLGEYNVTVDQANTEIEEYQQALEKANGNINKLISAYQQAETEHQQELAQAEQDLSDLQVELGEMQTRLDSQYEQDMNAIIEQANGEIEKANQEVLDTRVEVQTIIDGSIMSDVVENGERHELDTTGDKSVVEITDIVGE